MRNPQFLWMRSTRSAYCCRQSQDEDGKAGLELEGKMASSKDRNLAKSDWNLTQSLQAKRNLFRAKRVDGRSDQPQVEVFHFHPGKYYLVSVPYLLHDSCPYNVRIFTWRIFISLSRKPLAVLSGSANCLDALPVPYSNTKISHLSTR